MKCKTLGLVNENGNFMLVNTSLFPYNDESKEKCKNNLVIKDILKEHKALEIIKEKEVNVFIFLHSGDLETYNDMVEDDRKLVQEEYDLLKEIL